MDSWFQMLSPALSLRLPASGDVSMDYSPWTNWGISRPKSTAGNPEIEAEVFRNVALPGKQLGKLTDAVLALAALLESERADALDQHPDQARAIEALVKLAQDVERTKQQHKKSTMAEAIDAMERLKQANAEQYRAYVNDLQKENET